MTDVAATLKERGSRYGSFADHAKIAQGLQEVMRLAPNWNDLDPDMRQALCTISDKIARILNGDPYYDDNWHDIQGYAKLVEDRLHSRSNGEAETDVPIEKLDLLKDVKKHTAVLGNGEITAEEREELVKTPRFTVTPDGYIDENGTRWSYNDKSNDPNYDVGNYRG